MHYLPMKWNIALVYTEYNENLCLYSVYVLSIPRHIDFKVS